MKIMKKYSFFIILILSMGMISGGCTNGGVPNQPAATNVITTPGTPYLNQDGFLKPCDLLSVAEWLALFGVAPVLFEEKNGGCLISNQWETMSIFTGVYPQSQAYLTMQWFTQALELESSDAEFVFQLREVLENEADQGIRSLIDQRIGLYEALRYRTERIFVIGDYAIWFSYHESLTNILEILDNDQYLRIELRGFYPVDARNLAVQVGERLIERTPQEFEVLFNADAAFGQPGGVEPTLAAGQPSLSVINAEPAEIYFGSLCGEETTQVLINIANDTVVNNVVLVYRLVSQAETNQNWTTVFMSRGESGEWIKSLNAETDFNAYRLSDGAQVEVYIGILYGVDRVINSPVYKMVTVKQCGSQPPTAATQTP